MEKPNHIVIVPIPVFSHLLSILEFAKKLIQLPNIDFHVTCLVPTLGPISDSSKSILQNLPSKIHPIFLPPIHKENLPQGSPIAVHVQLTVIHSLPFITDTLNSLSSSTNLVAMIVDPVASDALSCAKEFNMLSFIYFPSNALALSFCLYLPKLDETVSDSVQFKDFPEPVRIPGCVPVQGRDLPNPVQDRSSEVYKLLLHRCKQLNQVDGIMVNSFRDIDAGPIRALTEEGSGHPSVYLVGPIIQIESGNLKNGSECLRWLNNQAPKSVLYVSFGSGGALSQEQLNELALGLELSGQKFLWVVRAPSESANSAYLHAENEDPLKFLPHGFLERTKEQGLVVPSWAPQVQVLSHNAIGGFLSHCGWNSTLESVINGVPIIAWPLFAEQRMNAVLLSDGLKVALRLKAKENGLVEREEVAKVIRRLMESEEGREIGRRMERLKNAAADSLQENGSSTKNLIQLATYLIGNQIEGRTNSTFEPFNICLY